MVDDIVYSGLMNSHVEFFENTTDRNDSGEAITVKSSLGKKLVQRIDAVGGQETDGRILGLAVCRYRLRYDPAIATKASQLIITDVDGDWDVVGPFGFLDLRHRYMELKCRKRGEN